MKTRIRKNPLAELSNRTCLLILMFCSLLLAQPLLAQQKPKADITPVNLVRKALQQKDEQKPILPSSASSQWYQQAIAKITEREYYFQPFEKTGLYTAANHAQRIGFLFNATGYTVKNIVENDTIKGNWEYHFTLQQVGKKNNPGVLPKLKNKLYTEKTLAYEYGTFNIEYLNDDKGMRQNFVINKKPAGQGKLQVVVNLSGDLDPSLNGTDRLLLSTKDKKQVKLAYDKLKVWDANQHLLAANMKLSGKNKLVISVDDQNAVYPVTVDPLNHTPNWTDSGDGLLFPLLSDLTTPVVYGYSVGNAGDLNGDGFSDIIIGAPLYVKILSISGGTFNPANVGAAFIYMGSPAGPTINPSEVLQPSTIAGAFAGFSVSTAGDIDNDGFSEVMLSAPGDRVPLTIGLGSLPAAVGKVYIYDGQMFDGNANTTTAPKSTVTLGQSDFGILGALPINPLYGFSIADIGDVNGDGFDDIAVGSPAYLDLATLTLGGKVDIYNGSLTGFGASPNRVIKGGLLNGLFGFSVSGAGKVNNDAFSDLIVGAPASIGVLGLGAAYVFHGSASGITATSAAAANTILQAPGLLNQTLFGFSVSNAGDVNNDGYGDVIVGEPLSLETTLAAQVVAVGKAHIYYGSPTGIKTTGKTDLTSPRAPSVLNLVQGNLLYGYSVSSAGDMDCDGIADVVVGEPGGTAISTGTGALGLVSANALSGAAYLYSGKNVTGPINTPLMTIQEAGAVSAANMIGYSVSNAGDVNGDGHPDIIIGAPNGTLSLGSSLTNIVGNAIGYITTNSIGSAYVFNGCFFALLPIHLLSFEAHAQNAGAQLNWTATGSTVNDRFEIERSVNGVSFSKIGDQKAVPGNGKTETYSFTDNVLPAQSNYYRLNMINADGKSTYSKVVLVKGGASASDLRISPNPAHEMLQLHFNNLPAGNYTLQMINAGGQTTLQQNISLLNGVYETKTIARTASMTAGTYFVRLITKGNQTISTSRVVMQ